jgi:ribosomal protein L7Ae-like RNA K-turn-binding protein
MRGVNALCYNWAVKVSTVQQMKQLGGAAGANSLERASFFQKNLEINLLDRAQKSNLSGQV